LIEYGGDAGMVGFDGGKLFAQLCMSRHGDKPHGVGDFFDSFNRFDPLPHMYEFCHDFFRFAII
jgi:hypothetical protein